MLKFDWFTKMNYLENQVQKQIDSKNTMTISHLHEFTENEIKKTHDRMKDTRLEEFKSNKQHKDDIQIAPGFFINKEDIKKNNSLLIQKKRNRSICLSMPSTKV